MEPMSADEYAGALAKVTIRDLRRRATNIAPEIRPATPPPRPSFHTLQKKGDLWLLTYPDGSTRHTFYKEALRLISGLNSEHGTEVRVLNHAGQVEDIINVAAPASYPVESPAPKAVAAASRQLDPTAANPAAVQPSLSPNRPQARVLRRFLEPAPRTDPYTPWGHWRVRTWQEHCLEVETTAEIYGKRFTAICYLIADTNQHGVSAFADMGEVVNLVWENRQSLLASPLVREVLPANGYLVPLLAEGSFDDAGLGMCALNWFSGPESTLRWRDGQPAALGTTPHTRFMVQRTFHIAANIIAEILALEQALERGPAVQAQAKTQTVWDQADSTLGWLDTNITRVGNILNVLGEIFDF